MFSLFYIFLLFLGSTIANDCYSVDGRSYCRCPSGDVEDLDHDGVVSCENNVPSSADVIQSFDNLGFTEDDGYILTISFLVFIILILSFLLLRRYRLVNFDCCFNPLQRSLGLSLQLSDPAAEDYGIELNTINVHVENSSNGVQEVDFIDDNVNDSASDYLSVVSN